MLELDHVFVFAAPAAADAAAAELAAWGLVEGTPNVHPGQGTANRRFFFANAFLELLFVRDAAEVQSPPIAATHLGDRARWRETGYSPYGVCVRTAGAPLPFPTWPYRPPYLPAGMHIDVAADTAPHEPFVFAIPFGGRPDAAPPDRRQPLAHPSGATMITALRMTLPGAASPALLALQHAGVVMLAHGDAPALALELDHARAGRMLDLHPGLPLVLRA